MDAEQRRPGRLDDGRRQRRELREARPEPGFECSGNRRAGAGGSSDRESDQRLGRRSLQPGYSASSSRPCPVTLDAPVSSHDLDQPLRTTRGLRDGTLAAVNAVANTLPVVTLGPTVYEIFRHADFAWAGLGLGFLIFARPPRRLGA
jgi:hypothetical protein